MTDTTRWQAGIAHATAAGTVPWQHATLATGLIGLVAVTVRDVDASTTIRLILGSLHAALLAVGLWLSLRLRIDAVLFDAIARADGTDAFDRAMADLGLLGANKMGRPMTDRVLGLMRLVRLLGLVIAVQLTLLAATGWLLWA